MTKDYRISAQEAGNRNSVSILDEVVFNIYDDCPDLRDDDAISNFMKDINPIQFHIFSAWMARTDLSVGGVFYIFEQNCKKIIQSSIEGFKLLKLNPIADIIISACQIFPSGIIPDRHPDIIDLLENGERWVDVENLMPQGAFNSSTYRHLKFNGDDVDDFLNSNKDIFIKNDS